MFDPGGVREGWVTIGVTPHPDHVPFGGTLLDGEREYHHHMDVVPGPVEVTVSPRCPHNCFAVSIGSRSVWYVAGVEVWEADPEFATVFHRHDGDIAQCGADCARILGRKDPTD